MPNEFSIVTKSAPSPGPVLGPEPDLKFNQSKSVQSMLQHKKAQQAVARELRLAPGAAAPAQSAQSAKESRAMAPAW